MGGVTIVGLVIIFLCLSGIGLYALLVDSNEIEGKWTIMKYFNFEGPYDSNEIDIPVIDPSMVDTSRGIRCDNCGCLYFPPRGLGIKGPAPKYCPECGKKMINWKEIMI